MSSFTTHFGRLERFASVSQAAELSYEASQDFTQPISEQKKRVLRQYNLWNNVDVNKVGIPTDMKRDRCDRF